MKVRASHILVKGEEKAKEILSRLQNGEDFGKLAMENSLCPSRKRGGDLGWFSHGMMVKEFQDKAFSMKIGELGIVKTEFGWHIIKLLQREN